MKPGIIFDLDGTLIDSGPIMEAAFRAAHAEVVGRGEPPLSEFFGRLGADFPTILKELGLPAAMEEPFRRESRLRLSELRSFDGVIELCRDLKARGVALAILTGKDRERTEEILHHFELVDLFGAVGTGSDEFESKPSPAGVFWLCRRIGLDPRRCCFVGDSVSDMETAVSAGCWAIGCRWGIAESDSLLRAGAHRLATDPEALDELLKEWLERDV